MNLLKKKQKKQKKPILYQKISFYNYMNNEKIPVYEFVFDPIRMKGVYNVSLVSNPANEVMAFKFNKQEIMPIEWKLANEEKRVITSAVLIPDQKIIREDINGAPGYVQASADTIYRLAQHYSENEKNNISSLEHETDVDGVNYFEKWIIEDPNNDKANALGFKNLPKGTWMMSAKINNDEVWNEYIKTGTIKGFSIDASLGVKPIKNEEIKMTKNTIEEIVKMAIEKFTLASQANEFVIDPNQSLYGTDLNIGTIISDKDGKPYVGEFTYEGKVYETDDMGAIKSVEPIDEEKAEPDTKDVDMADATTTEPAADPVDKTKELTDKIAELEAKIQDLEKENADLLTQTNSVKEDLVKMSSEKPASEGIKPIQNEVKLEDMTPLERWRSMIKK